ncbi:enoyl-CoA hydratase/isomerase family protein [Pseudonocardia benzenivorans]|uniref:Enoyl-CoA hydratase/isomerase n=2 Tax=Pseudonocardia TaxID=1847 RepID=F4CWU0_PSEUX|nr:enoyl-CoA hydratase/isomerase family protein [Pseudonocardia dioxanivorans]AEA23842.1 Enoyl-CoA hydratase/isomerase [Pseudonocardia dioxanivorans CB1190]GJF01525.1 enoyl-CoA hydratase [Pseudonocardia sp. D17]
MTDRHVDVKDEGRVRILTMDRPDRRNALTPQTVGEIEEALRDAAEGSTIGAVVLTGAGGHFSAGGDVDHILGAISGEDTALLTMMRAFHRVVVEIWESRLPVVAAVSGVAYGGGINLALACDLVVMSAEARLCEVFARRGIVPDVAGAYLLPRIVGVHRARELMLLAPEIDAARALEWGIANIVEPDPDAALATAVAKAAELASMPDYTVALTKKLVNHSLDSDLRSSLELEAVSQAAALRSKAATEGFEAFRQSRRRTEDRR